MERLRNMFGGQAADTPPTSGQPTAASSQGPDKDDESASLITSSESSQGGVFSKGQEVLEQLETGPDYKIAAGFLFFSALFFFAALTSLPMILLSPASFNLYFCFGSMFL